MQMKWYRMNRHYNLWMILVLEWGGVLLGTFTLNKVFIFVKVLVWVIFYKLFFLHNFYVCGNIYTHKMNRHDIEIVDNFNESIESIEQIWTRALIQFRFMNQGSDSDSVWLYPSLDPVSILAI